MTLQNVEHQQITDLSTQGLTCTHLVEPEEICVYEYVYEYVYEHGTKSS